MTTATPTALPGTSATPAVATPPARLELPPEPRSLPRVSALDHGKEVVKWMLLIIGGIILLILGLALIKLAWTSTMTSNLPVPGAPNPAPLTGSSAPAHSLALAPVPVAQPRIPQAVPVPERAPVVVPQLYIVATQQAVPPATVTEVNANNPVRNWPVAAKQRHSQGYNPVFVKDGKTSDSGWEYVDRLRDFSKPDPDLPNFYREIHGIPLK